MKDLKGFEEYYSITEDGRIFSKRSQRFLKASLKENGYVYIELNIEGDVYYKRVHRLVAETYIPNPDNKLMVNHKDGNKSNNHFTNLEWVSGSENNIHAIENGLFDPNKQSHTYVIVDSEGNELCRAVGHAELLSKTDFKKSSMYNYIKSGEIKNGMYKGCSIISYK